MEWHTPEDFQTYGHTLEDGRTDGRMLRETDGRTMRTDGETDTPRGRMDGRTPRTDRRTRRRTPWTDWQMDAPWGRMDGRTDGCTPDGQMDRRTHPGWTDGQTDARTDTPQMDRRMDTPRGWTATPPEDSQMDGHTPRTMIFWWISLKGCGNLPRTTSSLYSTKSRYESMINLTTSLKA